MAALLLNILVLLCSLYLVLIGGVEFIENAADVTTDEAESNDILSTSDTEIDVFTVEPAEEHTTFNQDEDITGARIKMVTRVNTKLEELGEPDTRSETEAFKNEILKSIKKDYGFFSVFMTKLFMYILMMSDKYAERLIEQVEPAFENIFKTITKLDDYVPSPLLRGLKELPQYIAQLSVHQIKDTFGFWIKSIENRQKAFSNVLNNIFDITDTLHSSDEKEVIIMDLKSFKDYPNIDRTSYDLVYDTINDVIFKPFLSLSNDERRTLVTNLNSYVAYNYYPDDRIYMPVIYRKGDIPRTTKKTEPIVKGSARHVRIQDAQFNKTRTLHLIPSSLIDYNPKTNDKQKYYYLKELNKKKAAQAPRVEDYDIMHQGESSKKYPSMYVDINVEFEKRKSKPKYLESKTDLITQNYNLKSTKKQIHKYKPNVLYNQLDNQYFTTTRNKIKKGKSDDDSYIIPDEVLEYNDIIVNDGKLIPVDEQNKKNANDLMLSSVKKNNINQSETYILVNDDDSTKNLESEYNGENKIRKRNNKWLDNRTKHENNVGKVMSANVHSTFSSDRINSLKNNPSTSSAQKLMVKYLLGSDVITNLMLAIPIIDPKKPLIKTEQVALTGDYASESLPYNLLNLTVSPLSHIKKRSEVLSKKRNHNIVPYFATVPINANLIKTVSEYRSITEPATAVVHTTYTSIDFNKDLNASLHYIQKHKPYQDQGESKNHKKYSHDHEKKSLLSEMHHVKNKHPKIYKMYVKPYIAGMERKKKVSRVKKYEKIAKSLMKSGQRRQSRHKHKKHHNKIKRRTGKEVKSVEKKPNISKGQSHLKLSRKQANQRLSNNNKKGEDDIGNTYVDYNEPKPHVSDSMHDHKDQSLSISSKNNHYLFKSKLASGKLNYRRAGTLFTSNNTDKKIPNNTDNYSYESYTVRHPYNTHQEIIPQVAEERKIVDNESKLSFKKVSFHDISSFNITDLSKNDIVNEIEQANTTVESKKLQKIEKTMLQKIIEASSSSDERETFQRSFDNALRIHVDTQNQIV